MIRRAAWRAVGLTELPAAQRKRSRLHGRAAPFRGRTAPEAEGVVTARGEPGAQVGGRSTRRGALAPGAGASERAAAAVAHVARAGQRAPSPADGSRGLGRPARNVPRRPPATRSQRGWRAPGRRGRHPRRRRRRRAPGALPNAGTRYRAHRKNARAAFGARGFVLAAEKTSHPSQACWPSIEGSIHEWGRRWSAASAQKAETITVITLRTNPNISQPVETPEIRAAQWIVLSGL